ncbi:MAG: hypothetical protein H6870_04235 [Methylobacteriaceae bacterium]|nr:hypothetical protein [Methylobacteriaceae bacterium]
MIVRRRATFRRPSSMNSARAPAITSATTASPETNAGVIAVHWADTPVDPASGALAIGVPKFLRASRIANEQRARAVGETGEIVVSSPAVSAGPGNRRERQYAMPRDGFSAPATLWMNAAGSVDTRRT